MTTNPKIEDLFSDAGPFNEGEIVKAIQPYVVINKTTHDIFINGGEILSTGDRILLFSLARKLLAHKGFIETETITAAEFHAKTRIKKGSIDPAFKKLRDEGLFVGQKEYHIPNHKINQVINRLSK